MLFRSHTKDAPFKWQNLVFLLQRKGKKESHITPESYFLTLPGNNKGSPPAKKRDRVVLTMPEKLVLLQAYAVEPYPTQSTIERLAEELQKKSSTIVNWFHNYRYGTRIIVPPPCQCTIVVTPCSDYSVWRWFFWQCVMVVGPILCCTQQCNVVATRFPTSYGGKYLLDCQILLGHVWKYFYVCVRCAFKKFIFSINLVKIWS